MGVVGPPIVLTRGELAEITVTNETHQPTAVHWHGMEVESFYDGVPGWAGSKGQIASEIAPGGSFIARMRPQRAGTYIYHTHWHDVAQLTSGLYGPLIVLEPGEKFDPATDKVLLIGRAGPSAYEDPILVNGSAQPDVLALTAGVRYRFRIINITPNDSYMIVAMTKDGKPSQWQAIGKDGAPLPPAQAVMQDASQVVTVGETYDFAFTPPAEGVFELSVADAPFPPAQKVTQYVTVAAKR